jgi:hypothetical protein
MTLVQNRYDYYSCIGSNCAPHPPTDPLACGCIQRGEYGCLSLGNQPVVRVMHDDTNYGAG